MKSLDDALRLRGQIFGAFERAEAEDGREEAPALMTFVVVGGGPTGVEMAGQLRELSRRALRAQLPAHRPVADPGRPGRGRRRARSSTMGERLSRITARDLTDWASRSTSGPW